MKIMEINAKQIKLEPFIKWGHHHLGVQNWYRLRVGRQQHSTDATEQKKIGLFCNSVQQNAGSANTQ